MNKKKALSRSILTLVSHGLVVGLIAGSIVSLFRLLIAQLMKQTSQLFLLAGKTPSYLLVIALFFLGLLLLSGQLIKAEKTIAGSGIARVEAELKGLTDHSWWRVLWRKFLLGVLAIGSGLFLGREGPSIQIGAMAAKGLRYLLKTDSLESKALIAAGAASGLAATFGAPLAGLLFVVEIIYHRFSRTVWITSLVASLTADSVSKTFFGITPAINFTGYLAHLSLKHYWFCLLMGLIFGFLGFFYEKAILLVKSCYQNSNQWLRIPRHYYSGLALILLLPIGYLFPHFIGGGQSIILELPQATYSLTTLIGLFALRFVFSTISYASGLPGGVFTPTLTLGAISGSIFGTFLIQNQLAHAEQFLFFIVAGMSAYLGAIAKPPLTAIVLICEVTGDWSQIVPLAIVTLVAYTVMDLLKGKAVYDYAFEDMLEQQAKTTDNQLTIISVAVTAKLAGKTLRELNLPEDLLIITQTKNQQKESLTPDSQLKLGETIEVVVRQDQKALVDHYLV